MISTLRGLTGTQYLLKTPILEAYIEWQLTEAGAEEEKVRVGRVVRESFQEKVGLSWTGEAG